MQLIESSHWRLWCDPEVGAQWVAAQVKHGEQWVDVVPNCRPAEHGSAESGNDVPAAGQSHDTPLPAANFHMIPYSNRIRDGQFSFEGQQVNLEDGERHAIHGALRKQAWRVVARRENSLMCEFDSRKDGAINWPWPMQAHIAQSVKGDTLTSTVTITNHGETDMPVGTGWHPYFVRSIGQSMPTLTLPVDAVFPDASGDCLPDAAAVALPESLDFRMPRQLDPDQRIDCCLAGLSGACHIHWQEAGIELVISSSEACRFLVLFNPDMPHFAIEPVTNANDAFNLTSQGIDSGTAVIGSGESFSVSMHIQLKLHD